MNGSTVVLGTLGGRKAAALIRDGRLDDMLVDGPEDGPPVPGSVLRAICDRPLKGQGSMIVRLPDHSGFLRHGKGLRAGQAILVQVTGAPEPGKAVPLTDRLLFKSRYAIATPNAPGINISRAIKDETLRVELRDIAAKHAESFTTHGLIIRSAAALADAQEIAADIQAVGAICAKVLGDQNGDATELLFAGPDAHALAWRDWATPDQLADGPNAFEDHDVAGLLGDIASPRVALAGGAFAFIEPTRALVAIDVNTGADTSPAAGLKANIALAKDLPRQLRCRGLGGQIAVDFAPMPKKDRRSLEQVLKSAFRLDPIETALAGWTPLGHFELQRKRERQALGPELFL